MLVQTLLLGEYFDLKLGKINVFTNHEIEQKRIMKTLANGFSGSLDEFLVEDESVVKNQYDVTYIDEEYLYVNERALKTKTIFYKNIYSSINENVSTDTLEIFEEFSNRLGNEVMRSNDMLNSKDNIFDVSYIENSITNNKLKIKDYLGKIINFDLMQNDSAKNMLKIILNLAISNQDLGQPKVIIIENITNYFTDLELVNFLEKIGKINHITLICTTNNYSQYKYIKDYDVINNDLKKINLRSAVMKTIVDEEYKKEKENSKISYDLFYNECYSLLVDKDYDYFMEKIFPYIDIVGKRIFGSSVEDLKNLYKLDEKRDGRIITFLINLEF